MPKFEVISEYTPSGDQPEAIAALASGIENGLDEQTLLGVTGSGKTYTMAKVIEAVQRPALVLAHNFLHLFLWSLHVFPLTHLSNIAIPNSM